jgi:hypothetical protein
MSYIAGGGDLAFCTGILGSTSPTLVQDYADMAIALVERNLCLWDGFPDLDQHCVLIEQYLLGACCAVAARVEDVLVQCMFRSQAESFDERAARRLGYTHLIASAKRNRTHLRALAERVQCDYPSDYESALRARSLGVLDKL